MNVDPSVRAHPSAGVSQVGSYRTRVLVRAARPQLAVMSAQLAAGAGNLLFAVVLARVLAPGEYASIVTFLALFVLLHVPSAALSAAGALSPERVEQLTARVAVAGVAAGATIIAASGPLGDASGLDRPLLVALGFAAPAAVLLGLARGVSYGHERFGRVGASLVIEPAVRLGAGVVLALAIGPLGAAFAVVASGYAALAVCATRSVAAVGFAFVLLAVVQSADLLVANRVLTADEADRFAVLSTIGGAAFFATSTIPLVLLPAVRRGRAQAAVARPAFVGGRDVGGGLGHGGGGPSSLPCAG